MRFRLKAMGMVLLGFTMLGVGVGSAHAAGSSPWAPIALVTATTAELGYLQVAININRAVNPDNCQQADFFVIRKADANYDEMASLTKAAFLAGREVQFRLVGCASVDGAPTRPRVRAVSIR